MIKRDTNPIGYLGRMTDKEYNELQKKHGIVSHRKQKKDLSEIRRLSNVDYIRLKEEI